MSRKLAFLLLALLLVCGLSAASAEITVTDMFSRAVTLDAPAARVVALSAAECEIICALGAQDTLVGRGAYCNYPEAIGAVPVVQSGSETNIEEILALNPQVVITTDMAQTLDQVNLLERNGIKVVSTKSAGIEGTFEAIRLIGAVLGKDAQAEALVADMQSTFDTIRANSTDTGKTVYFEVSTLEWGLWTAGADTFMTELAAMCGVTNAFSDVTGWAAISEEQVLQRNPDYIVSTAGLPDGDVEIMRRRGWDGLRAVRDERILCADADAITRSGPRLKDAALSLYEFFNEPL